MTTKHLTRRLRFHFHGGLGVASLRPAVNLLRRPRPPQQPYRDTRVSQTMP